MNDTQDSDVYLTVARTAAAEISEKQSRFIGFLAPADSVEAAESFVDSLRAEYHDATHHCSAYIIGTGDRRTERFNDDGEPSGSAGRPILNVIAGAELADTACVVVRYFGGTKLGVGGLVRAYGAAAQAVLDSAKIVTRTITGTVAVEFPYDMTGAVERLVSEFGAENVVRDFGETPRITCDIRKGRIERFARTFRDVTRDKGTITT